MHRMWPGRPIALQLLQVDNIDIYKSKTRYCKTGISLIFISSSRRLEGTINHMTTTLGYIPRQLILLDSVAATGQQRTTVALVFG